MALIIKFANNVYQEYVEAIETEEYYGGSSRRTLTFTIAPNSCNIQTLSDECTEANCATLELINDEEQITNIYEGYVLKLYVGIESRPIEGGGYQEVVVLKLGKRTYIEQRLHELGLL